MGDMQRRDFIGLLAGAATAWPLALPAQTMHSTEAPRTRNRPPVAGAFDANLGFPLEHPYWRSFFSAESCDISSTADLGLLTETLLRHGLDFSYLPAASCFFLRGDDAYQGLASALSQRARVAAQSSVLAVKRSNPAKRWQELRGARLGYINAYCTTSYFAPSILLAREGLALTSFFRAVPVAAWQGQIDAVVDGAIDATMVYEDVWLARSDNASQTKILGRIDALPTPAFIRRADADPAFASRLKEALFAFAPEAGASLLYAGFADYQDTLMQRFFADLESRIG
jgi:phosphonate transport system substrate-binding protein